MAAAMSSHFCPRARRSASLPLFLGQFSLGRLEQFLARDGLAGARTGGWRLELLLAERFHAAVVAALASLLTDLEGQLVACHAHQQLDHLGGVFQVVLSQGGADEEAAEHGLADVHRVECSPQPRIVHPAAHRHADRRLVLPVQLLGGAGVTGS